MRPIFFCKTLIVDLNDLLNLIAQLKYVIEVFICIVLLKYLFKLFN